MNNKIEQQMLTLIEQIEHLIESDEFPNGSLSIIGSGKKPKKKVKESAPTGKGWEKTVKGMKKHPEIDNPFALAHWMKKKGYKPKNEYSLNAPKHKITVSDLEKDKTAIQATADASPEGSKIRQTAPERLRKKDDQIAKLRNKPTDAQT